MKQIKVKGAKLHNLKNIDVTIPKNKLVVATGVSGSGKSSLIFDILFEEGRKRYLQSLGILTGFEEEEKFDGIEGIGPTIAVKQSVVRQSNPRSTVGTKTGILGLLANFMAREGEMTDDFLDERLPVSYFSYNHPNGMCMECKGRGEYFEFDMAALLPDEAMTLGALMDSMRLTSGYARLAVKWFGEFYETPFMELPVQVRHDVLYGHQVTGSSERRSFCLAKMFEQKIRKEGEEVVLAYRRQPCCSCGGDRVGEDARRVLINGKHIGDMGQMTISELYEFLVAYGSMHHIFEASVNSCDLGVDKLTVKEDTGVQVTSKHMSVVGKAMLLEAVNKLSALINSKLGHLSLYRQMPSLSGGEVQRLFLYSHLETQMDSLIYVLDEPTVGLHESEKEQLIKEIIKLKENDNTVLVVEHDRKVIEMADHVIDIGPGAGIEGGEVVYQGDYNGLLDCDTSLTGKHLDASGRLVEREPMTIKLNKWLQLRNCTLHNLKNVDVDIPLGCLVGIAGVSGSGKSSLITGTMVKQVRSELSHSAESSLTSDNNQIQGIFEVSQAPIGRSISSNPASYIGIFDKIRKLFAETEAAVERGMKAGDFSFNSDGACEQCGGKGYETIWLGGDMSMDHTCSECHGKRYNPETLSIQYKDKSIDEVLEMSVKEATVFFKGEKSIVHMLKILDRIGMGYLTLGQPTSTLSGGEAQRIKLAKEIGKRRSGHMLYVLDEPTTGLSLSDTVKLIKLLDELVQKGHSVVVIEHDIELLKLCDWVIEMGPEGGAKGGYVIAEGTPEQVKANTSSVTGRYL